ncbi:hypothetical protein Halru_0205 [Halovivax ruber XH-70]|uniref:Uncharacterized protein n=1 Tax=Halovivax ruber (strain DSM 18193 / JCM 13892 / XH-70) TaxID=797302 RepID=L0I9E8_HALRX|nr:hypothetical protein [Halovivax ruber]AGB14851.1 hypothetical protein Halru_0205 [Halovivax ruber XH-70]
MSRYDRIGRRTVLKAVPLSLGAVGTVSADGDEDQFDKDQVVSPCCGGGGGGTVTLANAIDTKEDYNDEEEARIELTVSGPSSTSVQTNTLGLTWAMNHDGMWYHFENTTLEFQMNEATNPADSTVDWVDGYSQGTGGISSDQVQYALDTLWGSTPIPAPNPLDVERDTGLDINEADSHFSHDYGDYFGKIDEDACGGAEFNVSLGTDGSLEDGSYEFDVSFSTELWLTNPDGGPDSHVKDLDIDASGTIFVDTS